MNNIRRKQVVEVIKIITNIIDKVEDILSDEVDAYDNMPDGLRESDRGIVSEEAQENLEGAIEALNEAIDCLEEI